MSHDGSPNSTNDSLKENGRTGDFNNDLLVSAIIHNYPGAELSHTCNMPITQSQASPQSSSVGSGSFGCGVAGFEADLETCEVFPRTPVDAALSG